jgi:hypothetical protein
MRCLLMLCFVAALAACSNQYDTPIPKDLANIESIKPAIDKLAPDEKELVAAYIVRHTIGSALSTAFGVKADPIPEGMTIGKAIKEQRSFAENQKIEVAAKKVVQEKAEAERKALAAQMTQMLTVRLLDLSLHKATFRDMDVHSRINMAFEIANKGAKDISGIKGIATFRDKFGDTISAVNMKSEDTIPAGKTVTIKLGKDFSEFNDEDRKLASLDAASAQFELAPEVILFADGTKFELPKAEKK